MTTSVAMLLYAIDYRYLPDWDFELEYDEIIPDDYGYEI